MIRFKARNYGDKGYVTSVADNDKFLIKCENI